MTEQDFLQRGDFHDIHCEDFLISEQLTTSTQLIAVMDGCTMGQESAFASLLIGKLLRKQAKEMFFLDFKKPEDKPLSTVLRQLVHDLFQTLKSVQNEQLLEEQELLSTLILGVVNVEKYKAEILVFGDGLVYVDGAKHEFDQGDKPDYMGYHLKEEFESWFKSLNQNVTASNFSDLSICTDGIYSFKNYTDKTKTLPIDTTIEFLLKDDTAFDGPNFFRKKVEKLNREFNQTLTDDIAVIRLRR